MAYKEKVSLDAESSISLGGINKKTGQKNPTKIEGYYRGFKPVETDYGPAKLHIFQTAQGNVGVWGKSVSNKLLTSELIGQMVELSFTGMGKPAKGRQAAYEFKVRHDEDNRIDVAPIDQATEFEEEPSDSEQTMDEVLDEEPAFTPPTRGVIPTPSSARQAQVAKLLSGRK